MKKLALILLLVHGFIFAQEPISKKLGDFHTVKVFNGLHVEINESNKSKIEIVGDKADDVVVKNSDGILKIRLKFPDAFTAENVRIVLFCKNINVLDANEGATISSEETISQQQLEVKVQEGAIIQLKVRTKHLEVKSVSGGIIELTGTAENQIVAASTGGIYEAFELKAANSDVTCGTGARVEVTSSERLDAEARLGGTIYYKGDPEVLKTKKVLKGRIIAK